VVEVAVDHFFLDPRGLGNDCFFSGLRHFDHLFGEVGASDGAAIGYGRRSARSDAILENYRARDPVPPPGLAEFEQHVMAADAPAVASPGYLTPHMRARANATACRCG
jgi:hypothetical protein